MYKHVFVMLMLRCGKSSPSLSLSLSASVSDWSPRATSNVHIDIIFWRLSYLRAHLKINKVAQDFGPQREGC